jgi:hypothetical protein
MPEESPQAGGRVMAMSASSTVVGAGSNSHSAVESGRPEKGTSSGRDALRSTVGAGSAAMLFSKAKQSTTRCREKGIGHECLSYKERDKAAQLRWPSPRYCSVVGAGFSRDAFRHPGQEASGLKASPTKSQFAGPVRNEWKSPFPLTVIPAKAGIQCLQTTAKSLDPCLRRDDEKWRCAFFSVGAGLTSPSAVENSRDAFAPLESNP